MAKYYGKIGYVETVETAPSVWTEQITERSYYGDVLRNTRKYQNSENLNDNLEVSNELSILSDPYALQNFHAIRYVHWMGSRWKVSSVEVRYPRLILTIGGVYNGDEETGT